MRGVIFAMLTSMGVPMNRVLDLYAGSGALGIEALSRGAQHADFVDQNAAACAAIRANIQRVGLGIDRARVHCSPVSRALRRLEGPYDLILLDPPYDDRSAVDTLSDPSTEALWQKDSVMVYEHSRRDTPPARIGSFHLNRTRSHGSSSVSFYWQSESSDEEGAQR
jgi:16S rRNA (guanine966-N2)-methyltransferase